MSSLIVHELSVLLKTKMLARQWKITCAESCTGGAIAKAITDIPGSSIYFEQSFVTYSNLAKQTLLGVSSQTLEIHGAVSQEVVSQMAAGALSRAEADIAISVSGIAGPEGGTSEKPVGTVWFGFAQKDTRVECRLCHFSGDREAVRQQAVVFALETLCRDFL